MGFFIFEFSAEVNGTQIEVWWLPNTTDTVLLYNRSVINGIHHSVTHQMSKRDVGHASVQSKG